MKVTVRSFAKINIGLAIGPSRADGFHDLTTVYQTIGLHDRLQVGIGRKTPGQPVEITCRDARVPTGESNTCWRMAAEVMRAFGRRGKVTIDIEKRLPVQGGLGASSSNAAATLVAIEHLLHKKLDPADRLKIAERIGSDVPLFLLGGAVLGMGHGEQVFPLPRLPKIACVVAFPERGISTPQAFRDWDEISASSVRRGNPPSPRPRFKLTEDPGSDRIKVFSRTISNWLSGSHTGVSARGRNRAEALLLDLVRTGIANDFERVVFLQRPELAGVKRVLKQSGSSYTSLSGSGSSIYGLFSASTAALDAVAQLKRRGIRAQASSFLSREEYQRRMLVARD